MWRRAFRKWLDHNPHVKINNHNKIIVLWLDDQRIDSKKSREKSLKSYIMQLISKNMLALDCIMFVVFVSFLNFIICYYFFCYSKKFIC